MVKKFIVSGLIFTALCAVFYYCAFAGLFHAEWRDRPFVYQVNNHMQYYGGDTWQRFRDLDTTLPYDAVVLGSSHAYRGYNTYEFRKKGVELFNFGGSGQGMKLTAATAKEYLANYKGTVIIDIYAGSFEADGFEAMGDMIVNGTSQDMANEAAWSSKDIRALNLIVLRHFHDRDTAPLYYDEEYKFNGYVENADSIHDMPDFKKIGTEWKPKPHQQAAFEDLLLWLEERKIKAILVAHPLPVETQRSEYSGFRNYVDSINGIGEEQRFQFYDYTFTHQLETQYHFSDYNHLNAAGTVFFNDWLLREPYVKNALSEVNQSN